MGKDSQPSCSNGLDRESTDSTVASSSELRHVRFQDGLLPGQDEPHEQKTALAEWIFIDRDICGLSLHEYDPESEIRDFASSPYGYMFIEDLEDVVSLNSLQQHMTAQCSEKNEDSRREERTIDKALLMAGVHVNYLHAEPEEVQESVEFEVSI